jgi:hypothetical protein
VYGVLEKKNKSKSKEDPFMKTILASHGGMTIEQFNTCEKQRLYEKALSMALGTFHENLMGKFKDYETLPQGHSTGVDVISETRNETKICTPKFFTTKNYFNIYNFITLYSF